MSILLAAGAIIGGLAGVESAAKNLRAARDVAEDIEAARDVNRRRMYQASSILSGDLTLSALGATGSSRSMAREAGMAESAAEAGEAMSGLSGGFTADLAKIEAKYALKTAREKISLGFRNAYQQGKAQIGQYRDVDADITKKLERAEEQVDYLSSPFAFVMSAATGAMGGASMGASIEGALATAFKTSDVDSLITGAIEHGRGVVENTLMTAAGSALDRLGLSGPSRGPLPVNTPMNKFGSDPLLSGIAQNRAAAWFADFTMPAANETRDGAWNGVGDKNPWNIFGGANLMQPMNDLFNPMGGY